MRSSSELAGEPALTFLCGRYEGFDERIVEHFASDVVSVGRYVLAGGELAAMVCIDAVLRKLPGALGHAGVGDRGVLQRARSRGCPSTPTTRGRRSSAAGRCRTCCSRATTRRSAAGGSSGRARAAARIGAGAHGAERAR